MMTPNAYPLPCEISNSVSFELKSPSVLKCFHLNARSVRNKVDEFSILLDSFSFPFDVIMISETWLTDSDTFELPSFSTFTLNRKTSRGGGVCILVNDHFKCEILNEFSYLKDDVEILSVISGNIVMSVVYRPPSGNMDSFLETMESYLSLAKSNKYDVIIGGDFNIDMLCTTVNSVNFDVLLRCYCVTNMITTATRITPTSQTCIDLFLTNINSPLIHSGVTCCDISDHMAYIYFARRRS